MSGPAPSGHVLLPEERALLESELSDLQERLRICQKAAHRHTLWAMLGLSPAALIPLAAAVTEFGPEIIGVAAFFITAIEAWKAIVARMDVSEVQAKLNEVASKLEGSGS